MTGEIDHDVSEQGSKKPLTLTHRRETASFFLLSFLFWHRQNCRVEKVKGFLCYCSFCSLQYQIEHFYFPLLCFLVLLSGIRARLLVLPTPCLSLFLPQLLSYNPAFFLLFFILVPSLVVRIDQVIDQQQGSQLYLALYLSLLHASRKGMFI